MTVDTKPNLQTMFGDTPKFIKAVDKRDETLIGVGLSREELKEPVDMYLTDTFGTMDDVDWRAATREEYEVEQHNSGLA